MKKGKMTKTSGNTDVAAVCSKAQQDAVQPRQTGGSELRRRNRGRRDRIAPWKVKKARRSPPRFAVERWQGLWHEKRGMFDTYEKAAHYADELNAILEREYGTDNEKVKG